MSAGCPLVYNRPMRIGAAIARYALGFCGLAVAVACGSSQQGDGGGSGADAGLEGAVDGAGPIADGGKTEGGADAGRDSGPTSCTTPGDCAPTEGCAAGVCGPCTKTADCGADETCVNGACASKCDATLQSIVDGAATGAPVTIPKCIYRELVALSRPIALVARPGAEIRGSDVWANWKSAGTGTWTTNTVLPSVVAYDACNCTECSGDPGCSPGPCTSPSQCACAAQASCYLPQQVFVDGQPLAQIATGTPAGNQFVVDLQTGAVTLGLADDPSGHLVEVTTRDHWLVASKAVAGVTIEGFTMRHASSPPQHGALDTTGGACGTMTGWVVQSNHLLYTAGGVLTPNAGDHIVGNEIAFGGQEGANSTCLSHGLMQGNDVHDNNTENFSAGWEAAGVKGATTVGAVFDGNRVHDNRNGAAGLWCDIDCYDVTYSNNVVTHNSGTGIMVEISDTATITGNTVEDNGPTSSCCGAGCPAGSGCSFYGGAQILVSASPNVTVSGNTVSGAMGIGILQQYRADACTCPMGSPNPACCTPGLCSGSTPYHHVANVSVHDNQITETRSASGAGSIAGMVTDICNGGVCASGTAMAGQPCDATTYFDAGAVTFAKNAYHAPSCTNADWAWMNTGLAFAAWQSDGEDTAGTCGP